MMRTPGVKIRAGSLGGLCQWRQINRDLEACTVAHDVQVQVLTRPETTRLIFELEQIAHPRPIDADNQVVGFTNVGLSMTGKRYDRGRENQRRRHRGAFQHGVRGPTVGMQPSTRGRAALRDADHAPAR